MLTELYVEHFVLIDSLRLQFGRGLHVFTGETGAGKSLLLDATRLVLGGRASVTNIQRGADHALVEAVFALPAASLAHRQLEEWAIDADEETVVVSRILYRSGRSTCRVNGRSVTVQMLKTFGDLLVEMQGQHESQALLTSKYQRTLLDLYGQHEQLCKNTADAYHMWRTATAKLDTAQVSERERAQQLDMLKFQIDEIETASVQPGEEDALRRERQRLIAFDKLQSHLDRGMAALEDASYGAIVQLATAEAEAGELSERVPSLANVREMLASARVNAEEASFALNKFAADMEADPRRLEEIEGRLATLRGLTRKYGSDTTGVLAHLARCKRTYDDLMAHEERLEQYRRHVAAAEREYLHAAKSLHDARVRAADRLQADIHAKLEQLHMHDAQFAVAVTANEQDFGEDGYSQVEFLFSGNPGEPLMSLQKVASGGELSRTLLALKVVFADLEQVETLIFDEIDTGVSGEAAQRVAEMLRSLGAERQVLCVTHAAQVAAAGHEHFQIVKETVDNHTHTQIYVLNAAARRDEIGRLLGAGVSDETALTHADALLESFRKDAITNT